MGLLPTRAAQGTPPAVQRLVPAWRANADTEGGAPPGPPGSGPPAMPIHAEIVPLATPAEDRERDRELVGEYYAFIGDRLKARHQQNRKLDFTVDGFRRGEWSRATERAEAEGREPPPGLELSPAELQEVAGLRGYKERCAFYLAKLNSVLTSVRGLLDSGNPPAAPSEVVAWR